MATYLLVHGGFQGGWAYRRVARLLRGAGHEVYTPTLTALGERSHLAYVQVNLDTHVADTRRNGVFTLSKVTENEGLTGRWFNEPKDEKQRRDNKWASWGNEKSFWMMKRDLVEALRHAGFPMVFEYPIYDPYRESSHRATIVALKDEPAA